MCEASEKCYCIWRHHFFPHISLAVSTIASTKETGMSMSSFGGPEPPPKSPSWQGSPLGVDGPQRNTSR